MIDWDDEAKRAAETAALHHAVVHHGAMPWWPGMAAVFGNDGYLDYEPSQVTVGLLRQQLDEDGTTIVGFGLDCDGQTWALVVCTDDLDRLRHAVETAWQVATSSDLTTLEVERARALAPGWDQPLDGPRPEATS